MPTPGSTWPHSSFTVAMWPAPPRSPTHSLMQDPGHLFGYVIQGTVARWNKDDAALQKAYKDFLSHYDAEMKKGRPEYGDHERMMTDFQQAATSGQ